MAEKKKQNQPKHHASKSRAAAKVRRKKIIKAISKGKTNKQAGIDAGLSPKTASAQVTEILKEPETQRSFQQMLADMCPDDFHSQTYRECMEATKVISANVIAPSGEGMSDAHGTTKDFIDVPDYQTRLRAADSVSKLKGYISEKVIFPDKNGEAQQIGSLFTNMELATRMAFILKEAAKRKKANAKRSGKD